MLEVSSVGRLFLKLYPIDNGEPISCPRRARERKKNMMKTEKEAYEYCLTHKCECGSPLALSREGDGSYGIYCFRNPYTHRKFIDIQEEVKDEQKR